MRRKWYFCFPTGRWSENVPKPADWFYSVGRLYCISDFFFILMYVLHTCFPFWFEIRILISCPFNVWSIYWYCFTHISHLLSKEVVGHNHHTHSWTPLCSGHKFSSRYGGGTQRSYMWRSGTRSLVSQYYVMAHGTRPLDPFVCVYWLCQGPLSCHLPRCFKSYQDFTLMLFLSFNR